MAFLMTTAVIFLFSKSWISQSLKDFSEEELSTSLQSYVTSIKGVQKLQLAELSQVETFTRTSRGRVLWKRLELPSVVVSMKAPVQYTYYINLKKSFRIEKGESGDLRILVPPFEANPPALDLSQLQITYEKSSVFRDEARVRDMLLSEVSDLLIERSQAHKALVMDVAQDEIKEILQPWIQKLKAKGSVEIIFSDLNELPQNPNLIQ